MIKRFSEAGDTVVEVLIAIAIVSFVLGASYSVANKSFRMVRQAQEHTIAAKLAEDEVENLKTYSEFDTSGNLFAVGLKPYCLVFLKSTVPHPWLYATSIAKPNPGCIVTNGINYNLIISDYSDPSPHERVFKIQIYWDSLLNSNAKHTDQVSYFYQMSH